MLENSRLSFTETPPYERQPVDAQSIQIKKSTEILNNLKLEEKEREVWKLKQEIQELERTNAALSIDLKKFTKEHRNKSAFDVGVQTEPIASAINVIVESKTDKKSESELSDEEKVNPKNPSYDDEFEESESEQESSEAVTSDSGTVSPTRRQSRTSSVSSNHEQSQQDNSKKTGQKTEHDQRSLQTSSRVDAGENVVIIRLRSEIRNLRSKVTTLERKNRVKILKIANKLNLL